MIKIRPPCFRYDPGERRSNPRQATKEIVLPANASAEGPGRQPMLAWSEEPSAEQSGGGHVRGGARTDYWSIYNVVINAPDMNRN